MTDTLARTAPVQKAERDSTIELARIICMLVIIMHHFVVHGGGISLGMSDYSMQLVTSAFIPGGKICFDVFLVISTWFLCDRPFKSERFVRLYLEAGLYSAVFSIIVVAAGQNVSWNLLLDAFFPMIGNAHGFIACYLIFYLFTPFLYVVSKHITKKPLAVLVFLLFIAEVVSKQFGTFFGYFQVFYSELTLFVLFYFTSLYLKRYPPKFTKNRPLMITLSLTIYLYMVFLWKAVQTKNNATISFFYNISADESAIVSIVAGYLVFFSFYGLKMKSSKVINAIASTTLACLAIHDHNLFRYYFWPVVVGTTPVYSLSPLGYAMSVIVISTLIFFACAAIDILRQVLLEMPLFSIPKLRQFLAKIDKALDFDHSGKQETPNP